MTTPTTAQPSREAEIAARLDNPLKGYATERQYQDDCRYLLAQLQQARQERDDKFGGDALVLQAREGETRMLAKLEDCQAALQQAREALTRYGQHDLRCDAHPPSHFDMARPRPCTCGLDAALKDEGR